MENKIITISPIESFPSESDLLTLKRGEQLIIYYDKYSSPEKKTKAEEWKEKFSDYLIEMDDTQEYISIFKKITKEEIIENIGFFKKYEQQYIVLALNLLLQLKISPPQKHKDEIIDLMNIERFLSGDYSDWSFRKMGNYYFFKNEVTKQFIIVPITFKNNNKQLDHYCFGKFIEENKKITEHLPVEIYLGFEDWEIITNVISK